MKVTYPVFILMLLFFTVKASATNSADSLRKYLQDEQQPTEQHITALYELAKLKLHDNWDSALFLANQQKQLALQLNDRLWLAKGNFLIAYLYDKKDRHEEAVVHYFAAVDLFRDLDDHYMVSYTLKNLGAIYYQTYSYQTALNIYKECLTIDKELPGVSNLGALYIRMGKVNIRLKDYPAALNYFEKSLGIYTFLKSPRDLAECYNEMGIAEFNRANYEKATNYYLKAMEISGQVEQPDRLRARVLNNLGKTWKEAGDLSRSKDYFAKALVLQEKIGAESYVITTLNNIGDICRQQGDFTAAINFYSKSIQRTGGDLTNNEYVRSANNLYQLYKAEEKFDSALRYAESVNAYTLQMIDIKDRLERHNQKFRVEKLMHEYLVQKSLELSTASKRQNLIVLLSIMTFLLLLVIYLYRKSHQRKLALQEFNKELKAIARQLTDSIRKQSS